MTNNIFLNRNKNNITMNALASEIGVDPAYLFLAEKNNVLINIRTAHYIATLFEIKLNELFPKLNKELSDTLEEYLNDDEDIDDFDDFLLDNKTILIESGIDPSLYPIFINFKFHDNSEKTFILNTNEYDCFLEKFNKKDNNNYIYFYSDCRECFVNKNNVKEINISNISGRYSFFSSRESATEVTIKLKNYQTEYINISDLDEYSSVTDFIITNLKDKNNETNNFIPFYSDQNEFLLKRFILNEEINFFTISMGIIIPDLFSDEIKHISSKLEKMNIAGNA